VREPFENLNRLSDDKAKALFDAEERAVAECMRDEGFTYTPGTYAPREFLIQYGNVEQAKQEGYGIVDSWANADSMGGSSKEPADNPDTEDLSPSERKAFTAALMGTPPSPETMQGGKGDDTHVVIPYPDGNGSVGFDTTSCVARARGKVYGDEIEHSKLLMEIEHMSNDVQAERRNDQSLLAANELWRECMRGKNLDYERPGPTEKLDSQLKALEAGPAKQLEVEVAVADAECFQSEGLVLIYNTALIKYENAAKEKNESIVLNLAEMQAEALARANGSTSS
jgi:hypothetical protein